MTMRTVRTILAWGLAAVATAAWARSPTAPPEGEASVNALLAQADAGWPRRDEPERLGHMQSLLEQAAQESPGDYGVLWRLARLYFWISDDPALGDDQRMAFGKRAWEYGDRATAVNPDGAEGWYFAAVGVGNYGLGLGVLKALSQGIEGKFKERLERAQAIAPDFFGGGIWNAWGRYYFKLPWPRYDPRKSEEMLHKALGVDPDNVRAHLFLAELYEKEGHPTEARKLLHEALSRPAAGRDLPEERRSRALATAFLQRLER